MLLPNYLLVILVSLPLLISSSPQKGVSFVCSSNLPCSPGQICNKGYCIPCDAVGCGKGANCDFNQAGQSFCFCPGNTQGDPNDHGCRPVTGCEANSNCGQNKICSERTCIDNPCLRAQCPGDRCKVVRGQAQCQTQGCANNSHCRKSEICSGGRCIDNPCLRAQCHGDRCKVVQGQAQCHTQACADNSHCRENEICSGRICIDNPCLTAQCPGDRCKVVQGQAQCQTQAEDEEWCPDLPLSNCPRYQNRCPNRCHQSNVVGDRNQVINNQVNSQVGSAHGGSQEDGAQVQQQGSVNNGIQVSGGAQNSNINHVNADQSGSGPHSGSSTQSGSRPQSGSGAQNNNQGGITQGGCTINSHCGSNERCQSRRCVDPCASFTCGEGAICQVSQRQGHCICPENSQGDPLVQCHSKQETPMNNATQPSPSSNITESNTGDTFFPDHVSTNEERTRDPGCITAPDPGECRGAFKRFYYNKQNDQCDCFLFGGCDEELIEFTWLTFEECQHICVPGKKIQGPGCKRATVEEVTAFLEEERRNRENKKN